VIGPFRGYQRKWLRGDIVAGVTVAAIAVPESLGYATIAGLPVQTGLYCALLPAVLFALLASSRQLVVGADSATAALVAAGAATVATAGSAEYAGAVGVLGLMVAALLLLMAVARLGFLADLISRPVLSGFLSGVGVSLIIGKLPAVLGLDISGTTWQKLTGTISGLDQINIASALLGLGVVLTMVGYLKLPAKIPAALFAVVAFSALGYLFDVEDRGVEMVGAIPPGLPDFALPSVSAGDIPRMSATAASIAIVILAQSAAVARSYGAKNGYPVNVTQDLAALSAANAGSAVTGGFAINGSPPRTAAGDSAGGRTQLVNIVMAVVIGLLLVVGSGLFDYIPSPVLDAVVLGLGIHLIKVRDLRRVARSRPVEFATAMLCLVVVAFVGVEQGILLAVVVALLDRLRRQSRPGGEVLIFDGTVVSRLQDRLSLTADQLSGVLMYRFGTSLFFGNANYFSSRVAEAMARASTPVTTLVLDCAAMDDIDFTGSEVLEQLANQMAASGGRLVLVELDDATTAAVRASDLAAEVVIISRIEALDRLWPQGGTAARDASS
jgi:SulP family sulfate permease